MNNLDKYFEKARKVEPDISQEDSRRILAGKLSDGGITTNLYHKIRTYPMITTLITSAAIVGILMLSQFAEPTNDNTVKQNNKTEITNNSDGLIPFDENEPKEYDHKMEKEFIKKNPPKPTDENVIEVATLNNDDGIIPVDEDEPESYDHKKEKELLKKNPPRPVDDNISNKKSSSELYLDSRNSNWTSDEIDIKSVNTLKLTNDELNNLGIVVDRDNFKVNAFNKYAFTIYADNEKEREYFDEEKDRDAFPTPAMVTTANGFKSLTLFKNDGIEAIVDRVKSDDGDSQSLRMTSEIRSDVDFDVDENLPEFKYGEMTFEDYKTMLSGHKDSSKVINRIENLEDIKLKIGNKEMTFSLKDLLKSGEISPDAIEKFTAIKELDDVELDDNVSLKVELEANSKDGVIDEFKYIQKKIDRKVTMNSDDLSGEDIEKVMNTSLDSLDGDVIELVETDADVDANRISNGRTIQMPINSLGEGKKIKIKSIKESDHDDDVYVRDLLQRSNDKVMIKKISTDNQSQNYSVANEEVNIDIKKILSQEYTNEEIEKIMAMDGDVVDVQIMYNENREYHVPVGQIDKTNILKTISTNIDKNSADEPIVNNIKIFVDSTKINNMLNGTLLSNLESKPDMLIGDDEINTIATLNIDKDKKVGMLLDKPGQKIWTDNSENDSNTTRLYSNKSFSLIKHDINKLIPIEVSLDGKKTDFIVWYEATDDFLEKLPNRLIQKINPELSAADDQAEHCDNEPVKKDNAVMDVWSGCSGAIKGMKLYPNPAVDQSSVELSLEEDRNLSIAVYNLSGQLIKRIGTPTMYSKGQLTKPLDLSGINSGLYYVVVKSEIGEQALQRIIIE